MTAPLIGLTTSRVPDKIVNNTISVTEAYVQAVSRADGAPVLIPNGISEEALEDIVNRLDGILFTGGGDVKPERYGAGPHPKLGSVDEDRDRVELWLFQEITRRKLPFLGICRGIQLINVAMGGTLYGDIADQHPGAIKHDYYLRYPRNHPAHPVELAHDSRLAGILGATRVEVNSLHHQGVARLAPAFQATGHAPDGLVEALELPDYPFGLAVQWHPEWLPEAEAMQKLFRAFVQAASEGRA